MISTSLRRPPGLGNKWKSAHKIWAKQNKVKAHTQKMSSGVPWHETTRFFPKLRVAHVSGAVGNRYVSLETPSWSRSNHHTKRVTGPWYWLWWYMMLGDTSSPWQQRFSVIYLPCNTGSGNGLAVQKAWQCRCHQHQSSNPPNESSDGRFRTSMPNALLSVWFLDRFTFTSK